MPEETPVTPRRRKKKSSAPAVSPSAQSANPSLPQKWLQAFLGCFAALLSRFKKFREETTEVKKSHLAITLAAVVLVAFVAGITWHSSPPNEAKGEVEVHSVSRTPNGPTIFAGKTNTGAEFMLQLPNDLLITTREAQELHEAHVIAKQAEAQSRLLELQMASFQEAYAKYQEEAKASRQEAENKAAEIEQNALDRAYQLLEQQRQQKKPTPTPAVHQSTRVYRPLKEIMGPGPYTTDQWKAVAHSLPMIFKPDRPDAS